MTAPGDSEAVTWSKEGPIGHIVLNGPEKLNPLSNERMEALDRVLDLAAADEEVRVAILKGAGRAFSAGYSLDPDNYWADADLPPLEDSAEVEKLADHLRKLWNFPKPIIAQVHGYCMAGGTQFAAMCDITLVAEDATIGMPTLPLGGGFIAPLWVHLVGPKRAKEMSFVAGSRISGVEAASWGWANRAVPAEELDREARILATRIAATPSQVLRVKKLAVNFAVEAMGLHEVIRYGTQINTLAHTDEEVIAMHNQIRADGLPATVKGFQEDVERAVERIRDESSAE
jgi:enoyl-CoA hydratase